MATDLLTASDMAEALGCDEETVELAIRSRRLPAVKYGRGWRCTREAFLAELTKQALQNTEPKPANVHMLTPAEKKPRRATPPSLDEWSGPKQ